MINFTDPTSGIPFYRFSSLTSFPNLEHAVFTRHGGISKGAFSSLNVRFGIGDSIENVIHNREKIAKVLTINSTQIISANQTHSDQIAFIKSGENLTFAKNSVGELENCDALITDQEGVFIMIQVADCQALFFYDPVQKVIAGVHAGWKGLLNEIIPKTIKAMQVKFACDPQNLIVSISPSLSWRNAQFVERETIFLHDYYKFFKKPDLVDLEAISRNQLIIAGVKASNIECSQKCTFEEDEFFSYRRSFETGRFACLIGLKSVK
jgi:YfiH family protein